MWFVVVSPNWREAARTLMELAELNDLRINEIVYFDEPYVGNLGKASDMPNLVDNTYKHTRSQHCVIYALSCKLYVIHRRFGDVSALFREKQIKMF